MIVDIDWPALIKDILEHHGWSCTRLASELKSSQQAVSSWKRDVRTPSVYFRKKLRDIIEGLGINVTSYEITENHLIVPAVHLNVDPEIIELAQELMKVDKVIRTGTIQIMIKTTKDLNNVITR